MKWIFITLAGGILALMAYSTYSSMSVQLKSSAISNTESSMAPKPSASVESVEKALANTKKSQAK